MCNNFPNLTKTIIHRSKKFSELLAQETEYSTMLLKSGDKEI